MWGYCCRVGGVIKAVFWLSCLAAAICDLQLWRMSDFEESIVGMKSSYGKPDRTDVGCLGSCLGRF